MMLQCYSAIFSYSHRTFVCVSNASTLCSQQSGNSLEICAVVTVSTLTCAGINACVTVGRLEEAQQTMDAMRAHSSPDLRAFNILIKGYSRAGDVAALQRTLQSIRAQVLAYLVSAGTAAIQREICQGIQCRNTLLCM